MNYDELADFAVKLAKECGGILAEAFYKGSYIVNKIT